jgi:hypothetical protein
MANSFEIVNLDLGNMSVNPTTTIPRTPVVATTAHNGSEYDVHTLMGTNTYTYILELGEPKIAGDELIKQGSDYIYKHNGKDYTLKGLKLEATGTNAGKINITDLQIQPSLDFDTLPFAIKAT